MYPVSPQKNCYKKGSQFFHFRIYLVFRCCCLLIENAIVLCWRKLIVIFSLLLMLLSISSVVSVQLLLTVVYQSLVWPPPGGARTRVEGRPDIDSPGPYSNKYSHHDIIDLYGKPMAGGGGIFQSIKLLTLPLGKITFFKFTTRTTPSAKKFNS